MAYYEVQERKQCVPCDVFFVPWQRHRTIWKVRSHRFYFDSGRVQRVEMLGKKVCPENWFTDHVNCTKIDLRSKRSTKMPPPPSTIPKYSIFSDKAF